MEIILELCQISAITRKNQIDQVLRVMEKLKAKYESGWPVETMDTALITSEVTAMSYKIEANTLIFYRKDNYWPSVPYEAFYKIGEWNQRMNKEGKINRLVFEIARQYNNSTVKHTESNRWNTKCRVCGADAYDSGFSYECSGGCNG